MSNINDVEFAGIMSTFDLVDCIMDTIDNDFEFYEQSMIDIMEG